MSYCRWSSDNWKCDLYCYADCQGGYTTHVASCRILGEVPPAPLSILTEKEPDEIKIKRFMSAHGKQMAFLDTCKRVNIGLAFDGLSFNDATLDLFLLRLFQLREAGYNYPDYVLEEVREDMMKNPTTQLAAYRNLIQGEPK